MGVNDGLKIFLFSLVMCYCLAKIPRAFNITLRFELYVELKELFYRHFERKCQRELEDEGDEFADKESFITSSYKNKLVVWFL